MGIPILIRPGVGPRFGAVADFLRFRFGKLILQVKNRLELPLCRRRGVGSAKVSGKISRQFVRVMVDTVQLKAVLIISWVQAFLVVKLIL